MEGSSGNLAADSHWALALSVRDAARKIGISRSSMYEILNQGIGPATVKLGRRRVIRLQELDRWLAGREADVYRVVQ